MKALVTGATGFIGRHLTARLATEGYEVHALVRPHSKLDDPNAALRPVTVHVVDASGDNLDEIVARANPDITFHLATHFVAEHTAQDISELISSNVLFPCRVVDSLARHGNRQLVNCSTAWQHYRNEEYNPTSLYAATKQALLALLKYYVDACGFVVVDVAIPDTYGPHDRRPKLFSALYRAAAGSEPLALSAGDQLLDLVYVDDVVDALKIAAKQLIEGKCEGLNQFAIYGQRPLSLKELVSTFASITKLSPKIAWGARPYRKREMMVPWRNGKVLPGWKPAIGIEDGIRKMHAAHVHDNKY